MSAEPEPPKTGLARKLWELDEETVEELFDELNGDESALEDSSSPSWEPTSRDDQESRADRDERLSWEPEKNAASQETLEAFVDGAASSSGGDGA
jgi:hypothetical protein